MATPPSELDVALTSLLQSSLPSLFGSRTPTVGLHVTSDAMEIVPRESELSVSSPRPADQLDELPFDKARPGGPYRLTRSPYPGPLRVRLLGPGGASTLEDNEIAWDSAVPQVLTLNLRATRDVAAFSTVQVLYGVTAVFTTLVVKRTLGLAMEAKDADVPKLSGAVALALAVIELNRDALSASASARYADGDYGVSPRVKRLRLVGVTAPRITMRLLTLEADVTLTLNRALRGSEGTPIEHILSPGRLPDAKQRVQIDIEVSA